MSDGKNTRLGGSGMAGKVLVIGCGAAGFMAAITAARCGADVTVLESGSTPGKKILSTGNGRCNFTNRDMELSHFHAGKDGFPAAALAAFGTEETLAFFRELGLYSSDRGGYLYPRSEQAAAVRDALEHECSRLSVELLTGQKVVKMTSSREGFHLETLSGKRFLSSAVILAAGGQAAPKTGSDGSGFTLAASAGHRIIPPVPALTSLKVQETSFCRIWKGTRTKGEIILLVDGTECGRDSGELQLTDYGISGIPVFQVSRYASYGLLEGKAVHAILRFLPEFSPEDLNGLKEDFSRSSMDIGHFLRGLLPSRLVQALLGELGCRESTPCYALKGNQKRRLLDMLTGLELTVTGTLDFESAQVTAGGIDLEDVEPETLQSRLIPGLFFAGEVLDVDGSCGGYNLQWAWSSGYAAGKAAAERKNPPESVGSAGIRPTGSRGKAFRRGDTE